MLEVHAPRFVAWGAQRAVVSKTNNGSDNRVPKQKKRIKTNSKNTTFLSVQTVDGNYIAYFLDIDVCKQNIISFDSALRAPPRPQFQCCLRNVFLFSGDVDLGYPPPGRVKYCIGITSIAVTTVRTHTHTHTHTRNIEIGGGGKTTFEP